MDQLRARAYLDLLLGMDSRPRAPGRRASPARPAGLAPPRPGARRVRRAGHPDRPAGHPGPPGGPARRAAGLGPVDPWLARDLATAAAHNPKTTWCVTVTDENGHATGHGCARPEPKSRRKRAGPGPPGTGFSFTPASRDGPPGGYGTWRLRTPGPGPDLIVTLDPLTTDPCDHRHEAQGHDPGVKLRHLSQIRHATCTSPICRRPAAQCDLEHNIPYEAGGRTCLCNTGPKCRHDHRLKQHPKWTVDQLPDGTFRWTTPAGRSTPPPQPVPDLTAARIVSGVTLPRGAHAGDAAAVALFMSNISGVVARVFVDGPDTAIPLYQQLAQTTTVNRFGFRDVQLAQVGPFLLLSGDTARYPRPGGDDPDAAPGAQTGRSSSTSRPKSQA